MQIPLKSNSPEVDRNERRASAGYSSACISTYNQCCEHEMRGSPSQRRSALFKCLSLKTHVLLVFLLKPPLWLSFDWLTMQSTQSRVKVPCLIFFVTLHVLFHLLLCLWVFSIFFICWLTLFGASQTNPKWSSELFPFCNQLRFVGLVPEEM